jgi:hypothetical protein
MSAWRSFFRFFVEEAKVFRSAKGLHGSCVTLDSHTDTPMVFPGAFDLGKKAAAGQPAV